MAHPSDNAAAPTASVRPLKAVLFDAYGTLFDVHSIVARAEALFPGQGQALSLVWRDKQIEYTRIVTTSNHGAHYRPFWELTRAALRYAALRLHLDLSPQHEEALMQQYLQLTAFPENLDVLRALKAGGVVTGTLSNGSPEMLQAVVRSAGMWGVLDHVISVDGLRKYKTDPAAYALGPQTLGLPVSDILFVSSNSWDALAATWFGYPSLWVNRGGLPFEQLGTQPARIGTSLREVFHFFPNATS